MQSAQQVSSPHSEETLDRKAELYEALFIMLEEAGSRGTPRDALCVVSGILENLAEEFDEIEPLVRPWRTLLEAEFSRQKRLLAENEPAPPIASSVRFLVIKPQAKREE